MINSCSFSFFFSRFSSFTLFLLHQYLSLLPRPPTSLSVCVSVSPLSLSLDLSLSLPLIYLSISLSFFLSIYLSISLTSDTFFVVFMSLSISVYNSPNLSYPEGLFLPVFFIRPLPISPFLSLSLSLSLSIYLSLSLSLSISVSARLSIYLSFSVLWIGPITFFNFLLRVSLFLCVSLSIYLFFVLHFYSRSLIFFLGYISLPISCFLPLSLYSLCLLSHIFLIYIL